MIPIKGYATFHPLKHCIVGKAHDPDQVDESLKIIMQETGEDLDNLVHILKSFGVNCYRPNVANLKSRPPVSPRDYFVVLGENLFIGNIIAGYKEIIRDIDRSKIKWFLNNDISSGNMIRCGNHIHWDISADVQDRTQSEIKDWLDKNGYKLSITRHGWHMDGIYSCLLYTSPSPRD